MNSSVNISVLNNSSQFTTGGSLNTLQSLIISFINTIGYIYIVPTVCSLGFILNIICIIVFFRLRQNGNIYKYFLSKTIAEIIVLVIGAFIPYGNCVFCDSYQTLGAQIYKMFFLGFLNQICYTYSGLCEIIITIDRIFILKNKPNSFISYKIVMTVFWLFSFGIFIPILLANYIKALPNNKYSYVSTEFGLTINYTIYLAIVIITRNIFFFFSLVISNVLLLIEFKKYLQRKYNLVSVVTSVTTFRHTTTCLDTARLKENISANNSSNVKNSTAEKSQTKRS